MVFYCRGSLNLSTATIKGTREVSVKRKRRYGSTCSVREAAEGSENHLHADVISHQTA